MEVEVGFVLGLELRIDVDSAGKSDVTDRAKGIPLGYRVPGRG